MKSFLEQAKIWSEVWALLIPLAVYFIKRTQLHAVLKPVVIYLWIALFLNTLADFIWQFQNPLNFPSWARNNTSLYTTHSIVRLLLFSWFFNRLKQPSIVGIKKLIPYLFLAFLVVYFTLIKPFKSFYLDFNSAIHATEAALLLFYCLQYYLFVLQQEDIHSPRNKSVGWVVAGLTIYVAVNFFIFLFYDTLIKASTTTFDFAVDIWDVHNISYIVLCCFIAKGFYESDKS